MHDHARLVVTGANGFVGRHLVREAARRGLEVVGLVRSTQGARVVEQAGGRARLAALDDGAALRDALEGAALVAHLAQIGSERGGASYQGTNVGGARAVAEAVAQAGVPRLAFFSGLGVARYGQEPRCTNAYFLSKLEAELALYRSPAAQVVVFRPSFIVGPGDALVGGLLAEMAAGRVERIGGGAQRLQPIAVGDAAAAVLATLDAPAAGREPRERHHVLDLVGPEAVSFARFVERLAVAARSAGLAASFRVEEVSAAEADGRARAGGYKGMPPDELDCLLCDQVADVAPLRQWLGRSPVSLDVALASAVAGAA